MTLLLNNHHNVFDIGDIFSLKAVSALFLLDYLEASAQKSSKMLIFKGYRPFKM